jgi:hypothetical protein
MTTKPPMNPPAPVAIPKKKVVTPQPPAVGKKKQ